jgi:uncharacterized membrane protein
VEEIELIVGVFDLSGRADEAFEALEEMERNRSVRLYNAAVIDKDANGHTHLKEKRDLGPKRGALFGAITGALLGLWGGPAGAVVGAAAGAVTGGVAARKIDLGFSEEFLNELKDSLKPDHSAILVVVEQPWGEQVAQALGEYQGRLLRHVLGNELASQLSDT